MQKLFEAGTSPAACPLDKTRQKMYNNGRKMKAGVPALSRLAEIYTLCLVAGRNLMRVIPT